GRRTVHRRRVRRQFPTQLPARRCRDDLRLAETVGGTMMKKLLATVALAVMVPTVASAQRQAVDPHWLSVDASAKTARFQLIAGLTGTNGALNFNGFADGGLTLVIPVGWTVEMDFF